MLEDSPPYICTSLVCGRWLVAPRRLVAHAPAAVVSTACRRSRRIRCRIRCTLQRLVLSGGPTTNSLTPSLPHTTHSSPATPLFLSPPFPPLSLSLSLPLPLPSLSLALGTYKQGEVVTTIPTTHTHTHTHTHAHTHSLTHTQHTQGEVVTTIPTIGFNVETVTYKNIRFQVWDLGGQSSIRPYWRCYYPNTNAIIYVVDSADQGP
jgi:hypothetical protein